MNHIDNNLNKIFNNTEDNTCSNIIIYKYFG